MTDKAILDMARDGDPISALEAIETGEADVRSARKLILAALDAERGEDAASEIFCTLRSWTGRALRGSSGASELQEWHDLFKATAAQFRGALAPYAIRIEVLGELLYERTAMAENRRVEDILARRHVLAILSCIASAADQRMSRAEVGRITGLEQANLTRVSIMMIDAGLMARVEEGRTVAFELTAVGASHSRHLQAATGGEEAERTVDADQWIGPDPKQVRLAERAPGDPSMDRWDDDGDIGEVWKRAA